jgi:hypothetical protein
MHGKEMKKLERARTERMVIEEVAATASSGFHRQLAKSILKAIPERFSTLNVTPSVLDVLDQGARSPSLEGSLDVEDLLAKLRRDRANFPECNWKELDDVEALYAELDHPTSMKPSYDAIVEHVTTKRRIMREKLLTVQRSFVIFLRELGKSKKIMSEKFSALLETCTSLLQEVVRVERDDSGIRSAVERGFPAKLAVTLNQFKKSLHDQSYQLQGELSLSQLQEIAHHLQIVRDKIVESQAALKEFSSKIDAGGPKEW